MIERVEQIFRERPDLEREARMVYPLRRLARPLDVAYVALYLASDESAFVTGTTLVVDGGLTCQLADTLFSQAEDNLERPVSP